MIFPVERAGERGGGDRAEYINAFGSGKLRRLGRHRPNRGVDILRVDDRAGPTRRTRRGTPPINGAFLGRKNTVRFGRRNRGGAPRREPQNGLAC